MLQHLANFLVDTGTQCWTCPIFDALFAIISNSAGKLYQQMTYIVTVIFVILLSFYILNAVWQNIKGGGQDPFFQKTVKPVIIKSLIALTLLVSGLVVPRIISTVTFEPAAHITYTFSETMNQALDGNNYSNVAHYTAQVPLQSYSFFNADLRDTIIKIIESSASNFQVYIKYGIAIMDKTFSISAIIDAIDFNPLRGIAALIRHIIIFFIGAFLTYSFGKLFIKYLFCFMDIIVAMAMFAFFFPLSLVLFIFKDAESAPGWMKKLGGDLGSGQIKKLVNAIISIAAAILTYTIIMFIIDGFLKHNNIDPNRLVVPASLFNLDLDSNGVLEMSIAGVIVLVYVINYIADQVPAVADKILEAFNVSREDSLSKEAGENTWKLTGLAKNKIKEVAKTIIDDTAAKKTAGAAANAATTAKP